MIHRWCLFCETKMLFDYSVTLTEKSNFDQNIVKNMPHFKSQMSPICIDSTRLQDKKAQKYEV
jgi:hypothetical protein